MREISGEIARLLRRVFRPGPDALRLQDGREARLQAAGLEGICSKTLKKKFTLGLSKVIEVEEDCGFLLICFSSVGVSVPSGCDPKRYRARKAQGVYGH